MRILLLGSNGQLGTDLRRAVAAHPTPPELTPLTRADIDVAEPDTIGPALESRPFDALVNCTSYHKTDELEANAQKAAAVNAFAVRAMARACAKRKARFVHISTDYVFDGRL